MNNLSDDHTRLHSCLASLGLKSSDDVLLISDIGTLGLPPSFSRPSANLLCFYADALLDYFSNGTLLFITYTFNFTSDHVYIHESSKCTHGILNEYLRSHYSSSRSFHPLASVSAIGNKADLFTRDCGLSAFGFNSPFHRMIDHNVKVLSFGKEPGHVPIYHHAEQIVGCPFTYHKLLVGDIFKDGRLVNLPFTAFLRYKHLSVEYDTNFQYDEFCKEVPYLSTSYLRGQLSTHSIRDHFEWIYQKININPHYFLRSLPNYCSSNFPLL